MRSLIKHWILYILLLLFTIKNLLIYESYRGCLGTNTHCVYRQTATIKSEWKETGYFTKMYLQCSLRLEGHTMVLCISGTATASRSWLHLQVGFGLSTAPASSCSTRHTSKSQTVSNLCWSNTENKFSDCDGFVTLYTYFFPATLDFLNH